MQVSHCARFDVILCCGFERHHCRCVCWGPRLGKRAEGLSAAPTQISTDVFDHTKHTKKGGVVRQLGSILLLPIGTRQVRNSPLLLASG